MEKIGPRAGTRGDGDDPETRDETRQIVDEIGKVFDIDMLCHVEAGY